MCEIPGGWLQQGSHCVGFSFKLPLGLPSSFFYKKNFTEEKPEAKCKYTITALVNSPDDQPYLRAKQVLLIRQKPVDLSENTSHFMRSELNNYGCIGKGFSSLKTEFEKNIYCPNEVAKAIVTVDNSEATIDTDTVTFAVA